MDKPRSPIKVDFYNGLYRATTVLALLSSFIVGFLIIITIIFLLAKLANSELVLNGFEQYKVKIKDLLLAIIFFFVFKLVNMRLSKIFKNIYDNALEKTINSYKKYLSKKGYNDF